MIVNGIGIRTHDHSNLRSSVSVPAQWIAYIFLSQWSQIRVPVFLKFYPRRFWCCRYQLIELLGTENTGLKCWPNSSRADTTKKIKGCFHFRRCSMKPHHVKKLAFLIYSSGLFVSLLHNLLSFTLISNVSAERNHPWLLGWNGISLIEDSMLELHPKFLPLIKIWTIHFFSMGYCWPLLRFIYLFTNTMLNTMLNG